MKLFFIKKMPSKNFQLKSFTKFYKYFVGENLAALNFFEILFFFTSEKYL